MGRRDTERVIWETSDILLAVLADINQTLRTLAEQTARLAEATEERNRLEFDRRFSPQDLGIQFKTDESSPARDRGDKVDRKVTLERRIDG